MKIIICSVTIGNLSTGPQVKILSYANDAKQPFSITLKQYPKSYLNSPKFWSPKPFIIIQHQIHIKKRPFTVDVLPLLYDKVLFCSRHVVLDGIIYAHISRNPLNITYIRLILLFFIKLSADLWYNFADGWINFFRCTRFEILMEKEENGLEICVGKEICFKPSIWIWKLAVPLKRCCTKWRNFKNQI